MSYSGRSKQNGQFPTSSHLNKHSSFFQGHIWVLQNSISQTVAGHPDCVHEEKKTYLQDLLGVATHLFLLRVQAPQKSLA